MQNELDLDLSDHLRIPGEHREMVRVLVKDPNEILKSLTPEKVDLLHAAIGIATEAGEILSAVKAHVIYGRELDLENVVEEAGDSEFYWEQMRSRLNFTRLDALKHNLDKLAKRYENYQYSDKAAAARQDKIATGETDNKVL
jgi:hypothetical protein